jgi:uncharacterized protein
LGLILLQKCDDMMGKIVALKKDCPGQISKLEDDLKACRMRFQDDSDKLESLKKEKRKTEQLSLDLDGKIQKSNVKLSNIKSNKEYTAALKEIEDFNREKTKVEDGTLGIMEEIETCEKKCLENKNEMERLQKNFDTGKKRIEQKFEDLNREYTLLEQDRQRISAGLDKIHLARYEFLKARKGGLVISAVLGGVCQSCHLGIPPQRYYELISSSELMSCPHCNRFIYWGEDEFFVNALGDAADSQGD